MSNIPKELQEIKHIYDLFVSPGAYYFNKTTHEIHSGKRYKYSVKQHNNRHWANSIKDIYPYNTDELANESTELISLSCKTNLNDKCKTFNFDFDVLIKDILNEPTKFL